MVGTHNASHDGYSKWVLTVGTHNGYSRWVLTQGTHGGYEQEGDVLVELLAEVLTLGGEDGSVVVEHSERVQDPAQTEAGGTFSSTSRRAWLVIASAGFGEPEHLTMARVRQPGDCVREGSLNSHTVS